MKKIAIIAGSVLLLVGLAACGSSDTNSAATDTSGVYETPAPVVTVTEQAPAPISDDEQYLTAVHALDDPLIETSSDYTLLSIATNTCSALNSGYSISDIVVELADQGVITSDNAKTIGSLLAASVMVYCPEYQSSLEEFVNNVS